MTRLPTRIFLTLFTASVVIVLSAACKKDPPPAPLDLGGPSTSQDAGVEQLTPIDDAGDAAPEADAPKKKSGGGGGGGNGNAARIRACCNAIRHEAAKLGAAPEGVMMIGVAAQCDMVAAQVAGGSAPEFGQVRTMLKGHTIPNACQGM